MPLNFSHLSYPSEEYVFISDILDTLHHEFSSMGAIRDETEEQLNRITYFFDLLYCSHYLNEYPMFQNYLSEAIVDQIVTQTKEKIVALKKNIKLAEFDSFEEMHEYINKELISIYIQEFTIAFQDQHPTITFDWRNIQKIHPALIKCILEGKQFIPENKVDNTMNYQPMAIDSFNVKSDFEPMTIDSIDVKPDLKRMDIDHKSKNNQQNTFNITEIAIPFIPINVDDNDLDEHGRLFDAAFNKLKKNAQELIFETHPNTRISKKAFSENTKYSLFFDDNNNCYQIYYGKKKGKHIGEGSFGVGKLAYSWRDDKWFLLKSMLRSPLYSDETTNEYQLLKKVNLARGLITKHKSKSQEDKQYLLMELATGETLNKAVKSASPLRLLHIARNIISETCFIHQLGILHCDIKPENMIIDKVTGKVTLIDFGLAVELPKGLSEVIHFAGSPLFMAPEVTQGHLSSKKSDSYSVGRTLADLFHFLPDGQYYGSNTVLQIDSYDAFAMLPDTTTRHKLANIIGKMMHPKSHLRLGVDEALVLIQDILDNYPEKENIFIIDIDDFLKNRTKYTNDPRLYQMDEVLLTSKSNPLTCNKKTLGTIRKQLLALEIKCCDKLIQYQNIDDLDRYINHAKSPSTPNIIYSTTDIPKSAISSAIKKPSFFATSSTAKSSLMHSVNLNSTIEKKSSQWLNHFSPANVKKIMTSLHASTSDKNATVKAARMLIDNFQNPNTTLEEKMRTLSRSIQNIKSTIESYSENATPPQSCQAFMKKLEEVGKYVILFDTSFHQKHKKPRETLSDVHMNKLTPGKRR